MNLPSKKAIIVVSILLMILFFFVAAYLILTSSETVSARLLVEKNSVLVNDKEVLEEQILNEEDRIYVSETGSATLILYESVVVVLEPGTSITLKDLAKKNLEISQEEGGTWSQFTNLFGVEVYTVRTSTSVASVRGTGFYLNDSLIFVGEGEVDYDLLNRSFIVEENKAIEKFGEFYRERDMTPEEKEKAKAKKLEVIASLKKLRLLEIKKHEKMLDIFKSKYDFTDEDVSAYLEEADNGKVNLEDLKDKVPIKVDSVDKIIAITQKIKELNSSL